MVRTSSPSSRSGDNVRIDVRSDAFDESFDLTIPRKLNAEVATGFKDLVFKLVSTNVASVGSQPTYRYYTTFARGRLFTGSVAFAHPDTRTTVAVSSTTDNINKAKQRTDIILDSIEMA